MPDQNVPPTPLGNLETAVSAQLLPKEQYTRASGLRSMIDGSANIAPLLLAGLFLPLIGIGGINFKSSSLLRHKHLAEWIAFHRNH